MKALLPLIALSLLLPAPPARAGDDGRVWNVLITDKDPKGTNVRESPSGNVIKTIPFEKGGNPRLVNVRGQSGDWFAVEADSVSGWMHGSVLGTCAEATEDGAPALSKSPRNDSPTSERILDGAPVRLLGMHKEWLHVRYVDAKGKSHDGWLPEQALAMSENEWDACAKAWARH